MEKVILIVEDNELLRKGMRYTLGREFQVDEAINGSQGVAAYVELKPDLVLMDNEMPVMDGIEAIESIMKIDPNAKIIMLSGSIDPNVKASALAAGAKEFVTKGGKPPEVLLEVIKRLLEE